jgi:hypothetical protein
MTCAHNRHQEVYQRDDGLWQIGVDDDGPGPFESREFALSVAGYLPPAPSIPFRKIIFNKEARRRAGSSP